MEGLEYAFNKRKNYLLRNCAIAEKIFHDGFPAHFTNLVKIGFGKELELKDYSVWMLALKMN